MEKIPFNKITKITSDGIFYLNNNGNVSVIDLELCAKTYDAENNIQRNDSSIKCVGERFFDKYAYYELYTTEHTQIYMYLKSNFLTKVFGGIWNFYAKQFSEYYSIQKQLNAVGYTTFDLS